MSKARIHSGSLVAALLHLAWPLALAGKLYALVPLLQTFWLGRLGGPEALGVAAAIDPVLATVGWWVITVITVGQGSLVARAVGAGRSTTRILWSAGVLVVAATGGVAIVGAVAGAPIAGWLTHGMSDPALARRYLVAALAAFPLLGLADELVQSASAAGWTRLGLMRRICEVALFAALAPALYLVGLGVAGPPCAAGAAAALLMVTLVGTLRRRRAGVIVDGINEAEAIRLKRPDRKGAWIKMVVPGGGADRAGLSADDVIVSFDGKAITDQNELRWLASIAGVGKTVPVRVQRVSETSAIRAVNGRRRGPRPGADETAQAVFPSARCAVVVGVGRSMSAAFAAEYPRLRASLPRFSRPLLRLVAQRLPAQDYALPVRRPSARRAPGHVGRLADLR